MMSRVELPVFPGVGRKNDALFLYGAGRGKPFVLCYEQERVEVVCGPSCREVHKEINVAHCERDGVPISRRRGGGGTVVLSPGVLVTVVVGLCAPGQGIREIFSMVHRVMIKALQPLVPVPIRERGISDLAIGERKICGSSLYLPRSPAVFCYQSSLMVDCDTSLIGRYLHHPPREPDYRKGRGHAAFCTTLREQGCGEGVESVGCRVSALEYLWPGVLGLGH